ncbi:hypothetical protein [uncultured Maribacter sp.]|uniref:hypothetical protein n=1 Tax=uncultured Maribacter sp. TaxID=431308 RepID=UPI00260C284F|nr:hypothetical protein [uncultured Maribacter sp.]
MTNQYENTLRKLIIELIGFSDDTEYKISKDRVDKWKEKREIEKKKNKGILLEPKLIYYSDFYDLKTIIEKNWELFKPVLEDKKRFLVFFKEIEQFRNTLAHGRKLIFSQESLLNGIVMDLQNTLTIYHNRIEMKDDYFIQIGLITDSLGNSWGKSMFKKSKVTPVLKVGDEYEINIEANDPKDREIVYSLMSVNGKFNVSQKESRFNIKIDNSLVGKSMWIVAKVSTPETEYENVDTSRFNISVYPE